MPKKYIHIFRTPEEPETTERFWALSDDGVFVRCPCCGKTRNQIYKRRLYKSIVLALKSLISHGNGMRPSSVGDFTKLRHWGFIKDNNLTGMWEPTEKALDFFNGECAVPKYVFIQNNYVIGFGDETVFIGDIE